MRCLLLQNMAPRSKTTEDSNEEGDNRNSRSRLCCLSICKNQLRKFTVLFMLSLATLRNRAKGISVHNKSYREAAQFGFLCITHSNGPRWQDGCSDTIVPTLKHRLFSSKTILDRAPFLLSNRRLKDRGSANICAPPLSAPHDEEMPAYCSSLGSDLNMPAIDRRRVTSDDTSDNGWRCYQWNSYGEHTCGNVMSQTLSPPSSAKSHYLWDINDSSAKLIYPEESSVQSLSVRSQQVLIKRDDLLYLPGLDINGNKARKFLSLSLIASNEFPDAVVSYGGPQSNAMLALAKLVYYKDKTAKEVHGCTHRKRLVYFTKMIPKWLENNPIGNFLQASKLGVVEFVQLSTSMYREMFGGSHGGSLRPPTSLCPPVFGSSLWIPQGGACACAQLGVHKLAREIVDYWVLNGDGGSLTIALPGGTGSTALILHREINVILKERLLKNKLLQIDVVVIPCVGDEDYLTRQMEALSRQLYGNLSMNCIPATRSFSTSLDVSRFFFGKPSQKMWSVYKEMKDVHDLHLDLLYGCPAWVGLLLLLAERENSGFKHGKSTIMYIHTGGTEGLSSQIDRYKRVGIC